AGAPQKVLVVELHPYIIPAGIAGVIVDHPVWRRELVSRMCEATDHDHWNSCGPGEPRQATRQPDKKIGVSEPGRTLLKRPLAGLVLGAVRNVIPDQAGAVSRLLVDTDDAIAGLLQERDDLAPAVRIVPVFALGRALHRDADVGIRDRPAV